MNVDIYADILCPWCYIAKRRVTAALAEMDRPDRVRIAWRSFELSPDQSRVPGPTSADEIKSWRGEEEGAARIARIHMLGSEDGLELNLHLARPVNTFDAHRLVHLAARSGIADVMIERLFKAYHTEGLNIAESQMLVRLGVEAGLAADEARNLLAGDAYAEGVRFDEQRAAANGVSGVPSIVIDERPPVSGVQPAEEIRRLFENLLAALRG